MREQIAQSMFDYLLKVSNGQLLLTPEQLEKVTGISAKQQSVLRTDKKFPISSQKIGKLVFYSINDVIEYLLSGKTQVQKEQKKDEVKEVIITKNNKKIKDVSNIFMMKAFSTVLEQESQELLQLSYNLKKYADSFSLHEKFKEKYPQK